MRQHDEHGRQPCFKSKESEESQRRVAKAQGRREKLIATQRLPASALHFEVLPVPGTGEFLILSREIADVYFR